MTIDERIDELIKQVGQPYKEYNDNGSARGCAYPISFLYPDLPDFFVKVSNNPMLSDDVKGFLARYCIQIGKSELKKGDIILLTIRNEIHLAIYYEFGKMISVFRNGRLLLHRFNELWKYECFRMKEVLEEDKWQ